VGRWLGGTAALISGLIVFVVLSAVDLAKAWGLNVNMPPTVLSLVGAGAVYGALYWLFDRYAWKITPLGRLLKVPDLSGDWLCEGLPLESETAKPWKGRVTIVQSWDRLRLHLATEQSSSDSVAAALQHDAAVGYRLMYHYRNQPRPGERELSAHHGFAELTFARDQKSATGDYFNGRGRNTFGTIRLSREAY
jgi:hypothetical protein